MATMPERMAVVETKVSDIATKVDDIDQKVDLLVAWRNEERGARQQRALSNRKLIGLVGALSSLFGAAAGLALKVVGGS